MRPLIIIATVVTLATTPALFGRVINVPDDFETIQAAIDDAAVDEVDTVMLADGNYRGAGNTNLAINRELVLTSENGALETTIDCEGAEDSRTIFATTSVTISGLTLTNATINGLRVENAQRMLIEDCRFIANEGSYAQQSGGGIQLRTCVGTIRNCTFEGNTNIGSGGGIVFNTSQVSVEGCFFIDNHVERFGGALLITNASTVEVFNSLFERNTSGIDGGAVAHSLASNSTISFCTFIDNVATGIGGGLYKGSNSNPTVINSIFWGNQAERGDQLGENIPENGGNIAISYCIVEGGPDGGDGNGAGAWDGDELIDEDPMLTDGREPIWGMNGYYLDQGESPAVDAGSGEADDLGVGGLMTNPELRVDTDRADLGFHYWIGWYNIFGRLYGRVLDLEDNSPLEGVRVSTSLNQATITDEDGNWEIAQAHIGLFDVAASLAYYHTSRVEDQELAEDDELELIIRLAHPEFRVDAEQLAAEIGLDDTAYVSFNLYNDGNGPVRWSSYTKLRDEDNLPPWDALQTYPAGDEVGDTRITGVAFDGENYYISGADGNAPSKIYVLDAEGNQTGEFLQPGSARFGMRDLAWDGELLWGISDADVIGFTTDGDSITSFQVPEDPSYNITYDYDNELYWVSSTTRDFFSYDRDGNQVSSVAHGAIRSYGLAYRADDPDGATIYVHGNTAQDPGPQVFKVNPTTGEITQLVVLTDKLPANAGAEGIEIIDGLDPYASSMLAIYNCADGDLFKIWRLNVRDSWSQIEPSEGVIEGGESVEVNLRMISKGFDEGIFQAEAHFAFDARGDSLIVPIEMQVVAGDVHAIRTIQMPGGWSLVSTHVQPDNADIESIMQPLLDSGKLLFMKDTEGHIYAPRIENPFNNIQPWDVVKAYWIKLNRPGELQIEGVTVQSDLPIGLNRGWNGVAYLPRVVMDPSRAVGGIAGVLEVVRDGMGNFMLPRYNFSNLPPCRHGSGYLIRVSEATELIWGAVPQNDFVLAPTRIERVPELFEVPQPSGFTMSLLILAEGRDGDEIAVLNGGVIVGGGEIVDGMCGIAIVGDDPLTHEIEGASSGKLTLVKYGAYTPELLTPHILEGDLTYSNDGITVAELPKANLPVNSLLVNAFPNPFNSTTSVKVSIPTNEVVNIAMFDVAGRLISEVYSGNLEAGQHQFTINGGELSSGIYFLKLKSGSAEVTTRLLLMR